MNPSFPLLHLPESILSHVVKEMELRSLFGLSLVSTKAKNLVKTLNKHSSIFGVTIRELISFNVIDVTRSGQLYCHFYTELGEYQENETPRRLEKPSYIEFKYYHGSGIRKWEKKNYEMKDFIDHIQEIFHTGGIYLILDDKAQRFDIDSINETFKNLKELTLIRTRSNIFNNQVLEKIVSVKDVCISGVVFENQKISERVLIQNYDSQNYDRSVTTQNAQITLNDLLSVNSKQLFLYKVQISNEIINKFLKCWMYGSNSRLENIILSARHGIIYDKEAILKGLKYGTIPNEERKRFKYSFNSKYTKIIQGGFNIRRKDGTAATIVIKHDRYDSTYSFDMYVLHDYCVA